MTQTVSRTQKSTTVRMFSAPLPVRMAFRALEQLAPNLGARWANRIWFTLPRKRARGESLPGGTPFTCAVDGHTIVGTTWGHGPTVYLVHGWAGQSGQFTHLVRALVEQGFRAVAFDMPSHGRSAPGAYGPKSTTFVEFLQALTHVIARFGRPHAIVAHSAGAIATAAYLCDHTPLAPARELPADRVVLLAPMASAQSGAQHLAAVLNLGTRTYTRMLELAEQRVGVSMRQFDLPELGRATVMPPTLVIHDRDDAMTPVADGAAVAASWRGARLRVTQGLSHTKILRDPGVITQIVDYLGR